MEKLFTNRTAVVTGGARGIGRAICQMLASHGARVAVNYQQNDKGANETLALIEKNAEKAILVKGDVSREDEVTRLMQIVREQLGPIDFLVNNAGIVRNEPHNEVTFANWKRMFEVNVDGVFLPTWAVKDEMIARKFGRIVNISSLAGIKIKKDMVHYATTKTAVISFTRHCAEAFAPHVRVNCVAPGMTATDMIHNADQDLVAKLLTETPLARVADPSEMASVVKFLLSDDSSFVTGQTIAACGGRC
ncbi:MAG: glucose 1-dehydrogenase [Planctomycetota bacterium]|nr:glucose 1-dehydrogenase [Planctomycetota bacterium]MDA1214588.1 glucose 1-dehydrogenase [Planctomycetota bacterium]